MCSDTIQPALVYSVRGLIESACSWNIGLIRELLGYIPVHVQHIAVAYWMAGLMELYSIVSLYIISKEYCGVYKCIHASS